ncbi:DNA-processing protein DprA [Pararhodobacter oceanensis]|uniref:DNA-protecting protein DprA n=1 Tax=Pararhodobacter oceanensis TaxID=2172121 RepID=A0A2T8HU81_9RHOB|nr:DNA-processing protein DprA [Pararhodobacter oceanensis]PVH28988.1 DNA-protecting protein DprA [Pararhodobacter oceanensis]
MDGNKLSSPRPFTPPTTEEDRLLWLRLIRSRRVGPATFFRLFTEHGSAAAAFEALPGIARASGLSDYTPCTHKAAERELSLGRSKGAHLLCLGDPDYPAALAALSDPPPVLWVMGQLRLLEQPAVALVGARNASSLGLRTARKLAEGLGFHGFTTVSGLARGIDAAAHGASLKSGTVAVMAGGVDMIYPQENAPLAAAIADQGLRISEQPIGLQAQARHFPRRNRLISGLARAVIVIEAAEGSGSLITARDALDQGREVLAVPGHPLDARAAGCNQLIRGGAVLVRDVADVIEALENSVAPRTQPSADLSDTPQHAPQRPPAKPLDTLSLHRMILDSLGPAPVAEDQLLRDLGQPGATVAAALLFLELDGRVLRQPGGLLSRA